MDEAQIKVKAALLPRFVNRLLPAIAMLLLAFPARGVTLEVRPAAGEARIDVRAEDASLFALAKALEMRLKSSVTVDLDQDRAVDFHASNILPLPALRRLAREQNLEVIETESGYLLRDPAEPRLSIDVKDAPVREILQDIKQQCGIRNMMIDPDVTGKGTFLFDEVPCRTGIRIILKTLGLQRETYGSSVIRISTP